MDQGREMTFVQYANIDYCKSVLGKLYNFPIVKSIASVLAVAFSWVFDDSRGTTPLLCVFLLIGLDSISGTVAAVMSGEGLSSTKAKRIFWKLIVYGLAIITMRILDKMHTDMIVLGFKIPNHIFAIITEVYIALTEGQSVIENLGKSGFPMPTRLTNLFKVLKK